MIKNILLLSLLVSAISCQTSYEDTYTKQADKKNAYNIYFIGDSITSGFTFFPNNTWMNSAWDILGGQPGSLGHCLDKGILQVGDAEYVYHDNRCSNNRDDGASIAHWESGLGGILGKAKSYRRGIPEVAFPYKVQKMLDKHYNVNVHNWAVQGTTPFDWSSGYLYKNDSNILHGGFSKNYHKVVRHNFNEINKEKDNLIVLTAGGDPLLGYFSGGYFGSFINKSKALTKYTKMASTIKVQQAFYAAMQDIYGAGANSSKCTKAMQVAIESSNGIDRNKNCLQLPTKYHQKLPYKDEHSEINHIKSLFNLYQNSLQRGDTMVLKYYHICPWSFGGKTLGDNINITGAVHGDYCQDGSSKQNMAWSLVDYQNFMIDKLVEHIAAKNNINQIVSVCPKAISKKEKITIYCPAKDHAQNIKFSDGSNAWDVIFKDSCTNLQNGVPYSEVEVNRCTGFDKHQAFQYKETGYDYEYGDKNHNHTEYITRRDSGVHPSGAGHLAIANGLAKSICDKLRLFCKISPKYKPGITKWFGAYKNHKNSTLKCESNRCIHFAFYNDTDEIMTLNGYWASSGYWQQAPISTLAPGETGTAVIYRNDGTARGAEGALLYKVGQLGAVYISSSDPYNESGSSIFGTTGAVAAIVNGNLKITEEGYNFESDSGNSNILNIIISQSNNNCTCTKSKFLSSPKQCMLNHCFINQSFIDTAKGKKWTNNLKQDLNF